MLVTRRLAGLTLVAVAAIALPITLASPAQAACAPGTYPPSNCAPTLSLNAPTALATLSGARPGWSVKFAGAPISYYQLKYNRAAWNGNFQGWVSPYAWRRLSVTSLAYTLPIGYTYCFSARAVDTAGRIGAWTASRCIARPLDDRSLSVTPSWRRSTNSNYYLGTFTLTSRLNAVAVRTGVRATRLGVVGTTCSTCGTVGVYVGSTLVGRLSFVSSSTRYRVIRYTNKFSLRTGTVTLRNLSSGRRVILDGLVVGRT
jgi:hypothetical protein